MPKPNDGGPAFPQYLVEPVPGGGSYCTVKNGMTLRDWFAGQALAGAMSDPDWINLQPERMVDYVNQVADLMIAAREAKS